MRDNARGEINYESMVDGTSTYGIALDLHVLFTKMIILLVIDPKLYPKIIV